MKYMGSKSWMLANGLGEVLRSLAADFDRFVDLFCGAGAVSWYGAEQLHLPVVAYDLQEYAVLLAASVIERTDEFDALAEWSAWEKRAYRKLESSLLWDEAQALDSSATDVLTWCERARRFIEAVDVTGWLVFKNYGGYYFSPSQAMILDALLDSLPLDDPSRKMCHAALVMAASNCAAAPGHTAQPFQPTPGAAKYLRQAWNRDPFSRAKAALESLSRRRASKAGIARVGDAVPVSAHLGPSDLVFVDPPYSGVQYSRFYHVLETIARKHCGPVGGAGRYPPISERPVSRFSHKRESRDELARLLQNLRRSGATIVFTFPAGECSNGLSGEFVEETARTMFHVDKKLISRRFSTLGGNNKQRTSGLNLQEMILVLRPNGMVGSRLLGTVSGTCN